MSDLRFQPENPEQSEWDVIVVGTGVGGATTGYALARAGKKVLFCEKGRSNIGNGESLLDRFAETFFAASDSPEKKKDTLSRAGRWNEEIEDISESAPKRFIPFIGSGTGGSSSLYGMVMERFSPADFSPRRHHRAAADSTLPERWPIAYDDLSPYYAAAEQLYRVRGEADPLREDAGVNSLRDLPAMSPSAREFKEHLEDKNLHPYGLPLASEFRPNCPCCQGYLSSPGCKNSSVNICLEPALRHFGAKLMDQCSVLTLKSTRQKVTGAVCSWRGRTMILRAKTVILAAGALATPTLLLNSASADWPNGLANGSGLVGKNLMRHCIDLYVVFPEKGGLVDNRKELGFNDFYLSDGSKLGTVQSFGNMPPAEVIAATLEKDLRDNGHPLLSRLLGWFKPAVERVLEIIFTKGIVLAAVMEDLPYMDNSIAPSPDGRGSLVLNYRLRKYERRRIDEFRRKVAAALSPRRFLLIKQAENNERIAHACGTCRFGSDPADSALDAENRAHGLENLYVVDSSFFPSSGGTNPSLTIAANALRVADGLMGDRPVRGKFEDLIRRF